MEMFIFYNFIHVESFVSIILNDTKPRNYFVNVLKSEYIKIVLKI